MKQIICNNCRNSLNELSFSFVPFKWKNFKIAFSVHDPALSEAVDLCGWCIYLAFTQCGLDINYFGDDRAVRLAQVFEPYLKEKPI